ncbi:MAG: hypothetical protein KAQ64_00360 [Candidatus Pacebacteria bacterium]|nr:hypothetical protein [Candidatus Paceibacterota bacterium]
MEDTPIFVMFILFVEAGLFLFFIIALVIKIFERLKEAKKDKYKDIKK